MCGKRRILCLLASLLLVLLCACNSKEEENAESSEPGQGGGPPPTAVRVTTAELGSLDRYAAFTGELLAETIVDVTALESGLLVELLVDEGAWVERDERLAVLDNALQERQRTEAQARVETAEARREQARAELRAQENEVERRRELAGRNAFPEAELALLEDRLAVLRAAVSLAEAQLDEARAAVRSVNLSLERREVLAPFSGLVITRHVSAGATITVQTPLLTIVDTSSLTLNADVPEVQIADIDVGGSAAVTFDATPDVTFSFTVARLGQRVDRASRTVEVLLTPDEPDPRFRHGMFARGRFVTGHVDAAVVVPNEVLQTGLDGAVSVWTVQDGHAQKLDVSVVLASERTTAVEGITAGTALILNPPRRLQDGALVHVATHDTAEPEASDPEGSTSQPSQPGSNRGAP